MSKRNNRVALIGAGRIAAVHRGFIRGISVEITDEDTQDSLIRRTKSAGAQLIIQAIDRLEAGNVTTIPNDRDSATYFSFPTKEDGRRLRQQGRRFL